MPARDYFYLHFKRGFWERESCLNCQVSRKRQARSAPATDITGVKPRQTKKKNENLVGFLKTPRPKTDRTLYVRLRKTKISKTWRSDDSDDGSRTGRSALLTRTTSLSRPWERVSRQQKPLTVLRPSRLLRWRLRSGS